MSITYKIHLINNRHHVKQFRHMEHNNFSFQTSKQIPIALYRLATPLE